MCHDVCIYPSSSTRAPVQPVRFQSDTYILSFTWCCALKENLSGYSLMALLWWWELVWRELGLNSLAATWGWAVDGDGDGVIGIGIGIGLPFLLSERSRVFYV